MVSNFHDGSVWLFMWYLVFWLQNVLHLTKLIICSTVLLFWHASSGKGGHHEDHQLLPDTHIISLLLSLIQIHGKSLGPWIFYGCLLQPSHKTKLTFYLIPIFLTKASQSPIGRTSFWFSKQNLLLFITFTPQSFSCCFIVFRCCYNFKYHWLFFYKCLVFIPISFFLF